MLNVKKIEEMPTDAGATDEALGLSRQATRALIVEDNRFDRRRITHAAREAGLNLDFVEATNGAEAQPLLDAEDFGLCIFDYQLPDGDGVTLARALASGKNARTPVIIIAGRDDATIAAEAMSAGCADCLSKDALSPASLKRSVLNALAKSRLAREREVAKAEGDVLKMVLDRFSKDCINELRPTVIRMLRLIRNMNTEIREPRVSDKLRELESSGMLLFGFLQEIEQYADELPERYLSDAVLTGCAAQPAEVNPT
ncbi:MAG: response regulator [Paracoccaceae bacterium]|nr:response regulator [Paracoccaceae bacterium]